MNQLSASVVIGGYINGYSIVKELYDEKTSKIVLLDYGNSIARYSNKVDAVFTIDKNPESLSKALLNIHEQYGFLILFPTDDIQLEILLEIYDVIAGFCYIPFNKNNLNKLLDKNYQYKICETIEVPYPKSINLHGDSDFSDIDELAFPIIVKPSTRQDLNCNVFRTLYIENKVELLKSVKLLKSYLEQGVHFVVSEFIPGDDTNIYAYTCFRGQDGKIYNEWIGKKLTQFPDEYGIFSSASNEAPEVVRELGSRLIEAMDAYGIVEPEFKLDHRDGKFKLMEVNLRSMMWHRVGNLSGVKLHRTQFEFASGLPVTKYRQDDSKTIHFVLMQHEVANLIARKGYFKHFKYNLFQGQNTAWAIWDKNDVKPFIVSFWVGLKYGIKAWLSRLKII